MGNKQANATSVKEKEEVLAVVGKNSFEFNYVIGRGGFGKVWKVFHKKSKRTFALKEMSKAKIIDKKSEKSIKYERDLLAKIKHPFIVNMQFAFQDHDNLYLVMDLLTGGDLRFHVSKYKKFTEEQTKFFVGCILLGLDFIHVNNILHRDIKPENLVLDERGYVRITDFGIAKFYQKENSQETSGTPGYMSPEVMCAQNHTIAVDYFALGVLTYEFMMGVRPYTGKSRKEIKEKIMAKQVQVKKQDIPDGWSTEAADFVNRLLQRKPANRLGLRGATEVKEHAWLKYYPWKDLYDKKIEAPFIPKIGDNFDAKYCNAPEKIGNDTKEKYEVYLRDENLKNVFRLFSFYNEDFTDNFSMNKNNNNSDKSINKSSKSVYTKDINFINPHLNISNFCYGDNKVNSNIGNENNTASKPADKNSFRDVTGNVKSSSIDLSSTSNRLKISIDKNPSNNIENKFLQLKKQSNSSSTASLLRQYRQSNNSQNSTSTSINYLNKRSGSTSNINY